MRGDRGRRKLIVAARALDRPFAPESMAPGTRHLTPQIGERQGELRPVRRWRANVDFTNGSDTAVLTVAPRGALATDRTRKNAAQAASRPLAQKSFTAKIWLRPRAGVVGTLVR